MPDLSIFAMYKSFNANYSVNQVSIKRNKTRYTKMLLGYQIYGFFSENGTEIY